MFGRSRIGWPLAPINVGGCAGAGPPPIGIVDIGTAPINPGPNGCIIIIGLCADAFAAAAAAAAAA